MSQTIQVKTLVVTKPIFSFKPQLILVEPIRRKAIKIKEESKSRRKFQLWMTRSYRRWDKSEHFSQEA